MSTVQLPRGEEELVGRPAQDLVSLIRSGTVTPREVVAAHLSRIERDDRRVGAFVEVFAEEALTASERLTECDLVGMPLAGVPVAIKDNLPIAGHPTGYGSAATSTVAAVEDHEIVRRLREAGAIVIGKTRLSELALWPETEGPWGATHNPWDLTRTAGGSSGGSAAAVAAGMVPVAIGNDGLGSVRVPAAACGLVGHKPSAGLVPAEIDHDDWHGSLVNGVLATTVADVENVLGVLAGTTVTTPEAQAGSSQDAAAVRIGVVTRPWFPRQEVGDETLFAVARARSALQESGMRVADVEPVNLRRFVVPTFARWFEAASDDAAMCERSLLQRRTRRIARLGGVSRRLRLVKSEDVAALHTALAEWFGDVDVLLTPATALPPPLLGDFHRQSFISNMKVATIWVGPFVGIWNMAGYPATVVPVGSWTSGTPQSVQLVGTPGSDHRLLAIARLLEQQLPWPRNLDVAE
jgi:amidase